MIPAVVQHSHANLAQLMVILTAVAAGVHALRGNHGRAWGIFAVAAVVAAVLANPGGAGSSLSSIGNSFLDIIKGTLT